MRVLLLAVPVVLLLGCSDGLTPAPDFEQEHGPVRGRDASASTDPQAAAKEPRAEEADAPDAEPSSPTASDDGGFGGFGGGGGGGGGGADAGATDAAPAGPTQTASITIDGKAMTVSKIDLWAPNASGTANLFVQFSGNGIPTGTDVYIALSRVGAGCTGSPKPMPEEVWYRPPVSSADGQYHSADTSTCGMNVTSFPTTIGDRARGTFNGRVYGINSANGKIHTMAISFDVKREK